MWYMEQQFLLCDVVYPSMTAHMEEVIAHLLCLSLSRRSELLLQVAQMGQRQGLPHKLQAYVAAWSFVTHFISYNCYWLHSKLQQTAWI